MFLKHPKAVNTQPGSSAEFSVTTSHTVNTYNWYFQDKPISSDTEDTGYSGSTTDSLTITTCLSKHEGAYKCVVTDESGKTHSSDSASLTISEFIVCALCKCILSGVCGWHTNFPYEKYGLLSLGIN